MPKSNTKYTSQHIDNQSFDEALQMRVTEIIGADGILKNPATEEKQDSIVSALGESAITATSVDASSSGNNTIVSGVTYGPTGADYTGTLEQPAESDVLVGVQYGAGGTEFTGEATGGGGGFISIINE